MRENCLPQSHVVEHLVINWWCCLGSLWNLREQSLARGIYHSVDGRRSFGFITSAYFLFPLFLLCVNEMAMSKPSLPPPCLLLCLLCHHGLYPSGILRQNKPFLSLIAFGRGILSQKQKRKEHKWDPQETEDNTVKWQEIQIVSSQPLTSYVGLGLSVLS